MKLKKFSLVICAVIATIFSGGWLFSSDYLGVGPKDFMNRYNAALEGVKSMVGASSLDHLKIVSATIAACYACPEISKIDNLVQKLATFLDNVHKRGSDEYNEGKIKLMGVFNNGVFIFKAVYVD